MCLFDVDEDELKHHSTFFVCEKRFMVLMVIVSEDKMHFCRFFMVGWYNVHLLWNKMDIWLLKLACKCFQVLQNNTETFFSFPILQQLFFHSTIVEQRLIIVLYKSSWCGFCHVVFKEIHSPVKEISSWVSKIENTLECNNDLKTINFLDSNA